MFNIFSKPKEKAQLCFHTDIHCHVLPGIDDGARDINTSVTLVEGMMDLGINRIIASPHTTQNTFENTPEIICNALDNLKGELKSRSIDLDLSASSEYRIDDLLLNHIENRTLLPYPGDFLLIENSFIQEPWNIDNLVFDLQVKGYRPILAHPERYPYYWKNLNRYRTLHDAGLQFQINLLSLTGSYGKDEADIARHLIKEGLVDFIGTDIHRERHINTINLYLTTRQAHKDMEALESIVKNDSAFI